MYPQHPLRFGTLSSLRGTGLRVGGAAVHARVIQLEVPPAFVPAPLGIKTPPPRFPVCYGRVSSVRGSGLVATAAPSSASFDRAEYDVSREIAFRAAKAFAQLYAEAYPDVSGGVNITFEEI